LIQFFSCGAYFGWKTFAIRRGTGECSPLRERSEDVTGASRSKVRGNLADNLSKAGWSWGCVSAIDANGGTIWIADAHCGDGKRFVVRADEKFALFLEF
jgi:hypothetical protein